MTIAQKIAERGSRIRRIILREEILRTYDAVFDWRGGLLIVILAGAVLAFIILAWDKASGLSPEERKEIGILKAIGWETSDVLLMKFWEGMAVSLTSFLLGLVLAYVHVFYGGSGLLSRPCSRAGPSSPRVQAGPLYRRRPGRRPLFPDRRPLHRGHDHPVLAGGDRRPRFGDAVRRRC